MARTRHNGIPVLRWRPALRPRWAVGDRVRVPLGAGDITVAGHIVDVCDSGNVLVRFIDGQEWTVGVNEVMSSLRSSNYEKE